MIKTRLGWLTPTQLQVLRIRYWELKKQRILQRYQKEVQMANKQYEEKKTWKINEGLRKDFCIDIEEGLRNVEKGQKEQEEYNRATIQNAPVNMLMVDD